MSTSRGAAARLGAFVVAADPPIEARRRAAAAVLDTIGVALAGACEPAARIVQTSMAAEGGNECTILGAGRRGHPGAAALANGTAAHALDFDDMCFVSLAHPSAPLVAAALAIGESTAASGTAVVDAYVVGFEIEARLGTAMNPRHYERGWHCTSTLGTVGAAAAVARLLGLDTEAAGHAIAIAASSASGLKENFGTMVKPLHAGLAARSGVLAATLAGHGLTASALAIEGPQGYLAAMDSQRSSIDEQIADLGSRWEIVETGITVKLYPSCAGTHPSLDAILDLKRRERFTATDVERVEISVDKITPTVLIYDRPASGLEGKFSMPFCAAAAITDGSIGIESFDAARFVDRDLAAIMSRVQMRVDPTLDPDAEPLTQARVAITLKDGRTLKQDADGARGYPQRPASDQELGAKFLGCARRAIATDRAEQALAMLRRLQDLADIRELTKLL